MSSLPVIQQLLIEEYGLSQEETSPDIKLEDIGIDSLAAVELMLQLEDKLNIILSAEPVNIETIADIAREVDAQIEAQNDQSKSLNQPLVS